MLWVDDRQHTLERQGPCTCSVSITLLYGNTLQAKVNTNDYTRPNPSSARFTPTVGSMCEIARGYVTFEGLHIFFIAPTVFRASHMCLAVGVAAS